MVSQDFTVEARNLTQWFIPLELYLATLPTRYLDNDVDNLFIALVRPKGHVMPK